MSLANSSTRVLQPRAMALNTTPRAEWQSRYVRWLRISDAVAVLLAVGMAQRIRFGQAGSDLSHYWNVDYTVVSGMVAAMWLFSLAICRSRSANVIGAGAEEYRRVWSATISVFGAVAIASMLFRLEIARGYLALALPLGLAWLFGGRIFARSVVTRLRRQGRFLISVLVVGEMGSVRTLTNSLSRYPAFGYAPVGVCIPGGAVGDTIDVGDVRKVPVYGDVTDIGGAVAASRADTVALAGTEHLGSHGVRNLSWELGNLDVDLLVSPGVIDVASPRLLMRPVAELPLLQLEKPQYSGAKRFQKRAFDICFSTLVLLGAAPLMLVVAIAIKMDGKGPVFYFSERVGRDEKPFRMIKFRTMVVDADRQLPELMRLNESDGGVLFKIRQDPRVTPVGRVLRKYSIDELPQFINVLLGQMSVVGPRPPTVREVASYEDHVRRRLLVSPGITGLWQISGRSDLSWDESVRLDLSYVENRSMISDLMIVIKTIRAVVSSSGAY